MKPNEGIPVRVIAGTDGGNGGLIPPVKPLQTSGKEPGSVYNPATVDLVINTGRQNNQYPHELPEAMTADVAANIETQRARLDEKVKRISGETDLADADSGNRLNRVGKQKAQWEEKMKQQEIEMSRAEAELIAKRMEAQEKLEQLRREMADRSLNTEAIEAEKDQILQIRHAHQNPKDAQARFGIIASQILPWQLAKNIPAVKKQHRGYLQIRNMMDMLHSREITVSQMQSMVNDLEGEIKRLEHAQKELREKANAASSNRKAGFIKSLSETERREIAQEVEGNLGSLNDEYAQEYAEALAKGEYSLELKKTQVSAIYAEMNEEIDDSNLDSMRTDELDAVLLDAKARLLKKTIEKRIEESCFRRSDLNYDLDHIAQLARAGEINLDKELESFGETVGTENFAKGILVDASQVCAEMDAVYVSERLRYKVLSDLGGELGFTASTSGTEKIDGEILPSGLVLSKEQAGIRQKAILRIVRNAVDSGLVDRRIYNQVIARVAKAKFREQFSKKYGGTYHTQDFQSVGIFIANVGNTEELSGIYAYIAGELRNYVGQMDDRHKVDYAGSEITSILNIMGDSVGAGVKKADPNLPIAEITEPEAETSEKKGNQFNFYPDREAVATLSKERGNLILDIADSMKQKAERKGDIRSRSAAEIVCSQVEGIDFLLTNGTIEKTADGKTIISFNRNTLDKLLTDPTMSYKTRRDLIGLTMYIASEPVDSSGVTIQFQGENLDDIKQLSQVYMVSLGTNDLQWGTFCDEILFINQGSPEGKLDTVLKKFRSNFVNTRNPDGSNRLKATRELIMDLFKSTEKTNVIRICQSLRGNGLLDISDRSIFNLEDDQYLSMLTNEKTKYVAVRYIEESGDGVKINFDRFHEDIEISRSNGDGIGEWRFRIPKAKFADLTENIEWSDSYPDPNLSELKILYDAGLVDLSEYDLNSGEELFWQFWGENKIMLYSHQYKELRDLGLFDNLVSKRSTDGKLVADISAEQYVKAFNLSYRHVHVSREELRDIMSDPRVGEVIKAVTGLKENWGYQLGELKDDVKAMKYLLDNPDKMSVLKKFIESGYSGFRSGNIKLIEKLTPSRTDEILSLSRELHDQAGFRLSHFTTDLSGLEFVLDHPDVRSAITDLVEFGYAYKSGDKLALEYVVANRQQVMAHLNEIRQADPSYKYQPEAQRFSPYSLVTAERLSEGKYSYHQCVEIVFSLEKTGFRQEDFTLLSAINGRSDVPDDFVPGEVTADIGFDSYQWHKIKDIFKSDHFRNKEAAFGFLFKSLHPDVTRQKLESVYVILNSAPRLVEADGLHDFLRNNLETLAQMPPSKIETYSTIFLQIDQSPSQELQRLKTQLLEELMNNSDPVNSWRKIEGVFIKNNLPTVGKVFRVFEILHPGRTLADKLERHNNLSPFLKKSGPRRRMDAIYKDLLTTAIKSGNRSIMEYAECLMDGQSVLDKFERKGINSLDDDEKRHLGFFMGKLNTLHENSLLGRMQKSEGIDSTITTDGDYGKAYMQLRADLGVREGQSVVGRISEMFLRPVGINSMKDLVSQMRKATSEAEIRGKRLIEQFPDGKFVLVEGDLLKGVDTDFFEQIMQNGSVAREFLGAGAGSDATPFDTDVSMVTGDDANAGFEKAFEASIASGYGNLVFCVRDRGQFQRTNMETSEFDRNKLELFKTGVLGERHYGIRTGFPATEIDFMIVKDNLKNNPAKLEKIYYTIAQNGYYVPVVDQTGTVIFTPEMYADYRRTFEGIAKFNGEQIRANVSKEMFIQNGQVEEIVSDMASDRERISGEQQKIRQIVGDVLHTYGVKLKEEGDTGLLGGEFMDTGSTGRGTNTPGDADYDYVLVLDENDFRKRDWLAQEIKKRLNPTTDESHTDSGGIQIRAMKSRFIDGREIDVDIAITSKSDLRVFASHDAIAAKLESINSQYGPEVRDRVVANIILTKKVLKEGHAYKKREHGGIGGIGVENWILQNEGNMVMAFASFYKAAHFKGNRIPLSDFRRRYHIRDAGMNVKFLSHDDYVWTLKEEGYNAMLDTIEKYFTDMGAEENLMKIKNL